MVQLTPRSNLKEFTSVVLDFARDQETKDQVYKEIERFVTTVDMINVNKFLPNRLDFQTKRNIKGIIKAASASNSQIEIVALSIPEDGEPIKVGSLKYNLIDGYIDSAKREITTL